jgi:hypothetical protein
MIANSLPEHQGNIYYLNFDERQLSLEAEQEKIYSFFVEIVRDWNPEDVLKEFKRLFINYFDVVNYSPSIGIYNIFSQKNEQEFYNTFKRCCYIIINNWETNRKFSHTQELLEILDIFRQNIEFNVSSKKNIYLIWLKNFFDSDDYQDLQLFAHKSSEEVLKQDWTKRYTYYLLFAQSLNQDNLPEQQEAARKIYKRLKEKFKFELAMYSAHFHDAKTNTNRYKNPSLLGEDVLRLIQMIVIKKGVFSYENIANIFIEQTQDKTFKEFKKSIQKYLFFSVQEQKIVESLRTHISEKLSSWLVEYHDKTINKDLLLRTCNRIVDSLTIENGKEPSVLFTLLISQGQAITLVIVLLKIIFISKNTRSHLELKIANLIRYYSKYSADECLWLINFIEVFNITFTIYGNNTEYSLIKMKENEQSHNSHLDLDTYRVFSQSKQ